MIEDYTVYNDGNFFARRDIWEVYPGLGTRFKRYSKGDKIEEPICYLEYRIKTGWSLNNGCEQNE